jgi:hypothetical protein
VKGNNNSNKNFVPPENDGIYEELTGVFTSYVHANWKDLDSKLNELRLFLIQTKNIELGIDNLKKYLYILKNEIETNRKKKKIKANLFTKTGKVRKYRFGSDFCPNCNRFKNYEKECPYCSYHEMTI